MIPTLATIGGRSMWYLTRGSGIVALLMLTATVVLGIISSGRWETSRWPRFVVEGLHRNVSLAVVVFLANHVTTTVVDGFVPIGWLDVIIPFHSGYRPVWVGLGALAIDILLALIVTSLLRVRIGPRVWRGVHWLAYACWPIALVHALGTGSDPRTSWLAAVAVGSLAVVVLAVVARIGLAPGHGPARTAGFAAAVVVPVLLLGWYRSGPLASGWAHRAGTPSALLKRSVASANVLTTAQPPRSFSARVAGTVSQQAGANGLVTVRLQLRLQGGPHGALRIDLRGLPSGGGVSLTASGVSFVPATTGAVYEGHVTGLNGNALAADVVDGSGDHLRLTLVVSIDSGTSAVRGDLTAAVPGGAEQD